MFPRIFLVQGTARPLSSDTRMTIMTRERERERERETEDDVEGRKSMAFEVVFGTRFLPLVLRPIISAQTNVPYPKDLFSTSI